MILVDTSVWIDHLRNNLKKLSSLLEDSEVVIHPFVIGELACGNLKNRSEIVALLHSLPEAQCIENDEMLFFIDRHKLSGRGLGLIDMHLLASCCLSSYALWTKDKRLFAAAKEMNVAFQ
jgi:hypothetical protein